MTPSKSSRCTRALYRRLLSLRPLVSEHQLETAVCLDGTCSGRRAHGARFGSSTGVDLPAGCVIALHTHPAASYSREGVKVAWPSGDDFAALAWAAAVHDARLHIVISVEGVWLYRPAPGFAAALRAAYGTDRRALRAGCTAVKEALSCSHSARTGRAAIPRFLTWINRFDSEALHRPCFGEQTPYSRVGALRRPALARLLQRLPAGRRWFVVRFLPWSKMASSAR